MNFINPLTVEEIAKILGGTLVGKTDKKIVSLNRIEEAHESELAFFSDPRYLKYLSSTKASCILIPTGYEIDIKINTAYILVDKPYYEFLKLVKILESQLQKPTPQIHPTAVIAKSADVDPSAYIGPYCVVGEHCVLEKNVFLHSKNILYDNVKISENTYLHSSVICCSDTIIGKNCIIHPGAVIGSDGFSFIEHKDGSYQKIPQLGNVLIEDDVEIGANTTIDRAFVGSTIIEKGVKLDNLIHIAHNVKVGENTGMAAQVGVSGSSEIGKRNRLAGQVGISGHLKLADDVIIYAQSGVAKSVESKGI
jgi:UDP-3-O-[3-hydroxymyristoyl] glucosamine N-acyltransferase